LPKEKKTFGNQPEKNKIKNKNWVSELGENQSPEICGGFFDGHKTRIQSSPDIKATNKHTKQHEFEEFLHPKHNNNNNNRRLINHGRKSGFSYHNY
jgi:hypothetical protein